ncbi:MAG: hypothetical protein ACTSV3_06550 [Candidatus Thorarchaeota archaeon]|nr:MAG: hypothetical protein DRP09_13430 [Candidatus Thorarchaeota archaeon]RLI90161.1 MAG: hypothetical protein DRO89_06320 [Candidatus Altiarchaeales archaeon]
MTSNTLGVYREVSFILAHLGIAASMHLCIEIDEISLEWHNDTLVMHAVEVKSGRGSRNDFDKHWQEGPFLIKIPYSLKCETGNEGRASDEVKTLRLEARARDVIPEISLLLNHVISNVHRSYFGKVLKEIGVTVAIAIEGLSADETTDSGNPFLCSLRILNRKISWLLRENSSPTPDHASDPCKLLYDKLESQKFPRHLLGFMETDTASYELIIFCVGTYDTTLSRRLRGLLCSILKNAASRLLLVSTERSKSHLHDFHSGVSRTNTLTVEDYEDGSQSLRRELAKVKARVRRTAIIIPPFPKSLIRPILTDCRAELDGEIDVFTTAALPLPRKMDGFDSSSIDEPRILGLMIGNISCFVSSDGDECQ